MSCGLRPVWVFPIFRAFQFAKVSCQPRSAYTLRYFWLSLSRVKPKPRLR